MADYNRLFGRQALSAHNAHRPMLPTEQLERVFTWQEQRRLTLNLTLHYKRVLYLVEPSQHAQSAAGRQVLVREAHEGTVVIEYKGVALPARPFAKDARVEQAAIVDNKMLAAALVTVQERQAARDTLCANELETMTRPEISVGGESEVQDEEIEQGDLVAQDGRLHVISARGLPRKPIQRARA